MNLEPNNVASVTPAIASNNWKYPDTRPATSAPQPGTARLAVRQPHDVVRSSGWRRPSAKEIFIGAHQRSGRKWQSEQSDQLLNQRESEEAAHHFHNLAEVRRAAAVYYNRNHHRQHMEERIT